MAYPLIRYPLDPTGHNPNNLVIGEIHTLKSAQVRTVAPGYGPFFEESVVVYDHGTNVLLTKGVDYQTVHLLQDASLTFGKEICQIILITNRAVTDQVRINYQTLGGNYQNSAKAISDAYDTFVNDTRPVDWVNGILNKPTQFPPALHKHLLEDVVGFGSLAVAIERVGQAITLSNVPAFQHLLDQVLALSKNYASETDVLEMEPSEKLVTMQTLLSSLTKYNFNAITFRPTARKVTAGRSISFTTSSTNFPHAENLFWTVEHDFNSNSPTEDDMFGAMNGVFPIMNQTGGFVIPTKRGKSKNYGDLKFIVKLRRNTVYGPVVADSGVMTLVNPDPMSNGNFMALESGLWEHVCCLNEPNMVPSPEGMYLVKDALAD